MAEAAPAASESINPNVEVGAESKVTAGGGSNVSFEDIERITQDEEDAKAKAPKPRIVKEDKEQKEPIESGVEGSDEKGDKEAKPKEAAPGTPKPKVHKLKMGDQLVDVTGDATFTIPLNGKKVEVPLQELVNDYNGKTEWHRRMSEADQKSKDVDAKVGRIDSMVQNLYKKAVTDKDPDAAFDFMAEMTKQDPVEMKHGILRQQFEALLPVFEMPPAEREVWFEDQKRGWRDKLHNSRSAAIQAEEATKAEQAKRQEVMRDYGIAEERYTEVETLIRNHLKKVDPKFDGKVTQDQIIYADRRIMAHDVIEETIPELVNHEHFGKIEADIMRELLSHPELTREQLAKQLQAVFGSDNKGLRKIGEKVVRTATASLSETPRESRASSKKEATFFDDL